MRRVVVLAPFLSHRFQYAANGLRASRSLRASQPASLLLQSNSRPPHSFAAQPGVFVAGHECSAMAHTSVPLRLRQQAFARPHPPQVVPSLRLITYGALTCMRHWHVYPCLLQALSRDGFSVAYCTSKRTQPKTTLHSHEADCCAIAPTCTVFVSSAMFGSIHGCGADVVGGVVYRIRQSTRKAPA